MYGYCKNNPINKIDIDGRDDYFANNGIFLYSKGNGANIYIKQDNYFVNFSNIKLNTHKNMQMAAKVVRHYAKEVGIRYNKNGGTGSVGVSIMHYADYKGRILAATANDNIYLNVTSGSLDSYMYNANNMKSTLVHKNEHKKNHGETVGNPIRHAQISLTEMNSEFFLKIQKSINKVLSISFMVI